MGFAMRRGKIGDVYAVKVPNGYKLYQFAYKIPKWGDYIRVFHGLYDTIPTNIAEIANGPHDYIIGFFSSRLYRIGLAQFLENIPVPQQYPFPDYDIDIHLNSKFNIFAATVNSTKPSPETGKREHYYFEITSIAELPQEFQNLTLLSWVPSPYTLFFYFDYGFSISEIQRRYPKYVLGDGWEETFKIYQSQIDAALKKDRESRMKKRIESPNSSVR